MSTKSYLLYLSKSRESAEMRSSLTWCGEVLAKRLGVVVPRIQVSLSTIRKIATQHHVLELVWR